MPVPERSYKLVVVGDPGMVSPNIVALPKVTLDGNPSLAKPLSFEVCALPESFLREIFIFVESLKAIILYPGNTHL